MKHTMNLESLEKRKLMSVSPIQQWTGNVQTTGASSGLTAQSATPTFVQIRTTSHVTNDDSNTAADRDTAIKVSIMAATGHGGIDATSLVRAAVRITNLDTGFVLDSSSGPSGQLQKLKTTGGGDALIIQPKNPLNANTHYKVEINGSFVTGSSRVRDVQGTAFASFAATFITGSFLPTANPTINFTQITQTAAGNHPYVATTVGPDHKLYASTTDGNIFRYDIGSDGTLSNQQTITTIVDNNGGPRIITGIAFDPGSTANNLVMWVSHNAHQFGNNGTFGSGVQNYAPNFSGKISRISGPNLTGYQDIIINIPRSVKDHMNNQIIFSPDGRSMYFALPAMNAMGGTDPVWGNRVENIYSATIMQLRLGSASNGINPYMHAHGPVDLMIDGDQNTATGLVPGTLHYNIFRGSNPLRIYADGVRNAFDMVFGSNGHLYATVNGSSAGGFTPGTPADLSTVPIENRPDKDVKGHTYTGPRAQALGNVQTVEEDTLLDVKNGAYYGHPNAARGEYILDGGNPTSGVDPYEIPGSTGYPVGQQPDRSYTLPAYDFGQDFSADGITQYKAVGNTNKALNGYLLVARYSSGADILAIKPSDTTGAITDTQERINGFTNLGTPLDITEDNTNGNLYVTILSDEVSAGSIMLLKPAASSATAPVASLSTNKLGLYVTPGSSTGATKPLTISNTGDADLTIDTAATKITGTDRKNFVVTDLPSGDFTIPSGSSLTLHVKGVLASGDHGPAAASLAIKVNDPSVASGYVTVNLRAFDQSASLVRASANTSAFSQGTTIGSGGALPTSSVVSQLDSKDVDLSALLN